MKLDHAEYSEHFGQSVIFAVYYALGMDGTVDLGCYQCWLNPVGFMLLFK